MSAYSDTTSPADAALADPAVHKQLEQAFIRHVEGLLDDDRLRIDTTRGRRPLSSGLRAVTASDHAVDLTRLMSTMGIPDRQLRDRMPVGVSLEVVLQKKKLVLFKSSLGRMKVVCVSPVKTLLTGGMPLPLKPAEVSKVLSEIPPPLGNVPSTIVLMSTSGFTLEAHELADRGAERTVILVEPNKAGGWTVHGPVETKLLADLFDPEADESKRARVREEVDTMSATLSGAGIAVDKVAAMTQLPLQLVESELKNYAKSHPGLVAKRLDGRVVLFREGTAPPTATSATGGGEMPLIDRIKTLFARKGENEKKIAFLSERRTALMQQRDRSYEDIGSQEKQEASLRDEFKSASSELTKKRVTGQLLLLRKDIERRQQLLTVLNQQINVVSTHLHSLELVQQGRTANLPDSDEVASDAAKAEEMLADLEANNELVGSIGGVTNTGLSAEEQALYDELEAASAPPKAAPANDAVTPESARDTSAAVASSPPKRRVTESEPG